MAAVNPGMEVELTVVPRASVRFPLPMPPPDGFDSTRAETWPNVPGRLEFVEGTLLFMPPCGQPQQRVAADIATELTLWRRAHPEFVVGTNEAGMILGNDIRGADAAVWPAAPATPGFERRPPILAVEVTGQDEDIDDLLVKADWYLAHGVAVVWIVDPATRSVAVVTPVGRTTVTDRIPASSLLPDLSPLVADFFRQL